MRRLTLLLATLAATTGASAQSDPFGMPAAGAAAPAATSAASAGGKSAAAATGAASKAAATNPTGVESLTRAVNINSMESGTLLQVINQVLDTNSDSINPENGTMN